MTLLTELGERIEKIPDLESRKSRASRVQRYLGLLDEDLETLREGAAQLVQIPHVLPEADLTRPRESLRKANRVARRMNTQLEADWAHLEGDEFESHFPQLRSHARAVREGVLRIWNRAVAVKLTAYRGLVEAVKRADLPGAGDLKKAAGTVQRLVDLPPSTEAEAAAARDGFASLASVVEAAGWTGPVGEFLMRAATSAGAPPQDLLHEEVRAYIQEHALWSLFRVRMD